MSVYSIVCVRSQWKQMWQLLTISLVQSNRWCCCHIGCNHFGVSFKLSLLMRMGFESILCQIKIKWNFPIYFLKQFKAKLRIYLQSLPLQIKITKMLSIISPADWFRSGGSYELTRLSLIYFFDSSLCTYDDTQ